MAGSEGVAALAGDAPFFTGEEKRLAAPFRGDLTGVAALRGLRTGIKDRAGLLAGCMGLRGLLALN